jgi:hypothetical protein
MDVEEAIKKLREAGYQANYALGFIECTERHLSFFKNVPVHTDKDFNRVVLDEAIAYLIERKNKQGSSGLPT